MYGCEIWGPYINIERKNSKDIFDWSNNLICQKLHTQFCKQILQVNKKSSTAAVLGELGAYPLLLKVIGLTHRYLKRLLYKSRKDSLAYTAITDLMNNQYHFSWYQNVLNITTKFGININDSNATVKKKLRNAYKTAWLTHKNDNKKLTIYNIIKTNFEYEPYLNQIKNKSTRKIFTKLRVSDHILLIEKGRHTKLDYSKRTCPHCTDALEDEFHFIFDCVRYQNDRNKIMTYMNNKYKHFQALSDHNKCIYLMNLEGEDLKQFSEFCHKSYQIRSSFG